MARRDPERERVDELVQRVREASATEAEREELELYAQDREELALVAVKAKSDRALGGEWLARVEADKHVTAAERSPLARAERGVGMTLAVAGSVGAVFVPALGFVAVAGLGLLTWSVVRVRLGTAGKDPYKDIEK